MQEYKIKVSFKRKDRILFGKNFKKNFIVCEKNAKTALKNIKSRLQIQWNFCDFKIDDIDKI